MIPWDLIFDVLMLLAVALALGVVCERLRQSAIVGYVLAGVLLGPNALHMIDNQQEIEALAELGVALLLFTIGLEFSWRRMLRMGRVAFGGGSLQVLATGALAGGVSVLVGLDGRAAVAGGPYDSFGAWAEDCLACAIDGMLSETGGPVWDREAFERLRSNAREEIPDALVAVASDSLEILDEVRNVWSAMASLIGDRYAPAVADMTTQLDRLIYPAFLTNVGVDRLADLTRFVQAIGRRIERLPDHTDRDRERMERVQDLEAERDELSDAMPGSVDLIEVAWMLQELRVSLFAQEVGTKGKVSEKRITEAMRRAVTP